MLRTEFLKRAVQDPTKPYNRKAWLISLLAITNEGPDAYRADPYPYRIVRTPSSISFLDTDGALIRIDDAKPTDPLFAVRDLLNVDETWTSLVKDKTETTVGRLLTNIILLQDIFGDKIPYVNSKFKVDDIEKFIASRMVPTPPTGQPRKQDVIYIDEYLTFIDRLQYIASLASITNYAATPKNITSPPGIKAYREQLLKEYGDTLSDPVKLVEFETKLKQYSEDYFKDDPSNGAFFSGKVKDIGYRRMFLNFGTDPQMVQTAMVKPIDQPLSEGWSLDPDDFAAAINGLRAGSYARGKETVNGGVMSKIILRAMSAYTITKDDCGTKKGLPRTFTKSDIALLVSRYILQGNKWVLIETPDQATPYIGKEVIMRSPIYCLSKGDSFCRICAGEKLALLPNGLSLAAIEVSSIVMGAAMAAKHGKVISSAHFDYTKHFS